MQIHLIKPLKGQTMRYEAELVRREGTLTLVRAAWGLPFSVDLELFTIVPGDMLEEYFYTDRWYNIFAVYDWQGQIKGWYCNITRPAHDAGSYLTSEDLELDLVVAADCATLRVLDEDEFALRQLDQHDPEAYHAALDALDELIARAKAGQTPFVVA